MGAENRHGQSSYRKSCPISIYDVAAVETWLEDLGPRQGGRTPSASRGSRVDLLLERTVGVPLPAPAPPKVERGFGPGAGGGIPEHGLAAGGAAGALLGLAVR